MISYFFRLFTVAVMLAGFATLSPAQAQQKKPPPKPGQTQAQKIGYGGAKVQLQPFMVPTTASDGTIRYEVFTIRLFLDIGDKQRPGCWAIPMVHEKILMYLNDAKLTAADFIGQRLEVLGKNVFEVAIKATTKGYYAGYEIVTESTLPITPQNDPISATMSSQCK